MTDHSALQEMLTCVAESTTEALMVTDLEGRLMWFNRGFERMSGFDLASSIGLRLDSLQACDESSPSMLASMAKNFAQVLPFVVELAQQRRDGSRYWARIDAKPLRDRQGEVRWYLVSHKDITRTRERQSRLALQQAISTQLSTNHELDTLVPGLLSSLAYFLGHGVALAWEVQSRPWVGDIDLRCRHQHTAHGTSTSAFLKTSEQTTFLKGQGWPGQAWLQAGVRCVEISAEAAHDPRAAAALKEGMRHVLIMPIRSSRRVSLLFEFCSTQASPPNQATLDLLESVSQSIALVVDRIQDEARIHRLMAEFDSVFRLSSDGFVIFNTDGIRSYANPAFYDMTGLRREQLDGLHESGFDDLLAELCPTSSRPRRIAEQAGQDTPDRIEMCRPRPSVLMRSVRDMFAPNGERMGRAVYLRDVTKETEVDRMKSEFLSTAAHELRTPMVSVHGFSELLLKRSFTEERRQDIYDTIHRQSRLLINMVNELLDLARIESRAGKDFHIAPTSLAPILRSTIDDIQGIGDPRLVEVNLPEDLPEVLMDAEKFTRALMNVLSNAYKYSPGGGAIRLDIVHREGHSASLGVSVSDQGIGMTPEQLDRVFERFYRADPSCNIPGTGLGMSLVREIMTLLGGEVGLRSQHGQGTTVTLWLRLASPAAASPAALASASASASARASV